jgi:SulP family sulfate permease
MAYAMLAGMPPVHGLYAAAITPFIAALWGSLSQLATGPIAIMSLLVLTTLSPLAEPGSTQFVQLAFLLAFLVGVLYLGVGFFRLGELMSFISHSAVKGFTSAAALIHQRYATATSFGNSRIAARIYLSHACRYC